MLHLEHRAVTKDLHFLALKKLLQAIIKQYVIVWMCHYINMLCKDFEEHRQGLVNDPGLGVCVQSLFFPSHAVFAQQMRQMQLIFLAAIVQVITVARKLPRSGLPIKATQLLLIPLRLLWYYSLVKTKVQPGLTNKNHILKI